jgi:hypothetical protein
VLFALASRIRPESFGYLAGYRRPSDVDPVTATIGFYEPSFEKDNAGNRIGAGWISGTNDMVP